MKKIAAFLIAGLSLLIFTSCYSVFSGGAGGQVVDAESTATPKVGISSVDVYAYISENDRNWDYNHWKEGSVFKPAAEYYGHTTTGSDGSFMLSKIVWKEYFSYFGKDADIQNVYFLFYHENYGLTKGNTVIVSDGASDMLYQELTKVRKTIPLNITVKDVKDGGLTNSTVAVEISVPQNNGKITDAEPVVYKTGITGSGTVNISYPRYVYDEEGNAENNKPEITLKYYQADEDVTWKACYNGDNATSDYSFRNLEENPVVKSIPDYSSYSITLYGKACRISYPSFSGTYHGTGAEFGTASDDGKKVTVKLSDGTEIGSGTTNWTAVGTNGNLMHGNFNITSSLFFEDSSYKTKTVAKAVKFFVNGIEVSSSISEISSDKNTYSVSLQ